MSNLFDVTLEIRLQKGLSCISITLTIVPVA